MRRFGFGITLIFLSVSLAMATPKPDVLTRVFVFSTGLEENENIEFDPSTVSGIYVWQTIMDDLFEPLVYMTSEGEFTPGAARKWWYSDDGMSLFFELQPDRRWSDGTPVTAGDFVLTLERMRDPKFATSPPGFITSVIAGFALDSDEPFGVVAENPGLLRIDVTSKYALNESMLSEVAFSPLPRHVAPKEQSSWSTWQGGVSNGAYHLHNVSRNAITLKRNPYAPDHYKTNFETVIIKLELWPDAAEAFLSDDVDYIFGIPERQLDWFLENNVQLFNTSARTFYFAMNAKHPKLQDRRVRHALRLAVDRKGLVEQLYRGRAKPGYSIIPEGILGYEPDPSLRNEDVDAAFEDARALMQEAGYGPNNRLSLTFSSNYRVQYKSIAEFIKFGWAKIYVDLDFDIEEKEFQRWFDRFTAGDYEIGRRSWNSSKPRMDAFMDVCKPLNDARCGYYDDPEYKRILDQAYVEKDLDTRRALFQQADKMITEADVIIPLYHGHVPVAISRRIETDDFKGKVRKYRSHDFKLRDGP